MLQRLGRYNIVRELGRGGMGVVYLAEDSLLGRQVALKTLPIGAQSAKLRERFLREARVSAQLDHPCVIRLHDLGQDDGTDFLVMEFVAGRTLRALFDETETTPPMPQREAATLFLEVLQGVGHAHGLGIVHRDLKPENVMVTKEGHAKVMDFGLAFLRDQSHLTRAGAVMGTLTYFSPEQARGEVADERSDIYSLGAILFEMLTGRLVFEATTPAAMIMHHLQTPPPALRDCLPDGSPVLERIITKCLQKDPGDRYPSVIAVQKDLESFLRDEEAPAPPLPSTSPSAEPPASTPSAPAPEMPMASTAQWSQFKDMVNRMKGQAGQGAAAPSPALPSPPAAPLGGRPLLPQQPFPPQPSVPLSPQQSPAPLAGPAMTPSVSPRFPSPRAPMPSPPVPGPSYPAPASPLAPTPLPGAPLPGGPLSALGPGSPLAPGSVARPANSLLASPQDGAWQVTPREGLASTSSAPSPASELPAPSRPEGTVADMHATRLMADCESPSASQAGQSSHAPHPDEADSLLSTRSMPASANSQASRLPGQRRAGNSLGLAYLPSQTDEPLIGAQEAGTVIAEGVAAYQRGDRKEARKSLLAGVAVQPQSFEANYYLGRIELEEKRLAQAETHLLVAHDARPQDPSALDSLAQLYKLEGRPAQALEACRQSLALAPDNVETRCLLARLLARSGRVEDAIAEYERALKTNRDWLPGWRRLAQLYIDHDRPSDAARAFEAVARLDPANVQALRTLARLYGLLQNHARAEKACRAALELAPEDADLYLRLSIALEAQRKSEGVLHALRKAVELNPLSVEAQERLAASCLRRGQASEAREVLEAAIRHSPQSSRLHCQLGDLYLAEGDIQRAGATFERALELDPVLAAADRALGQPEIPPGLEPGCCQEAVNRMPGEAMLREALALSWYPRDKARAAEEMARAARLDCRNVGYHKTLAAMCEAAGQLDQAVNALLRVLELAPDDRVACTLLGRVRLRQGLASSAAQVLAQAVERAPLDMLLHLYLGRARRALGQTDRAMRSFRRALEICRRTPS